MLYKNTLMKIRNSLGRYLSLFTIILFGVGVYAGLIGSGPNILSTVDHFYQNYQLLDLDITSNLGLVDEDVASLLEVDGVKRAIPTYVLDVLVDGKAVRIHALEKDVNGLKIIDGRWPESQQEVLADAMHYQVGDVLQITRDVDQQLRDDTFTVVGIIHSPQYMAIDYGSTSVGDGTLCSFIYMKKENFMLEAYTNIYIKPEVGEGAAAYTEEYDDMITRLEDAVQEIKGERETERYEKIVSEAMNEIADQEQRLRIEQLDGENKLSDAKAELEQAKIEIAEANRMLLENEKKLQGEAELAADNPAYLTVINEKMVEIAASKELLEEKRIQIEKGYETYEKNYAVFKEKIASASGKIKDAKDEINKMKPVKWYIQNRDSVVGYEELKFSTDAINSVVVVFPVFLILIVILMTSNTMARMIVEERGEFGTLSSLGYSNGSIISTYLLYVLSATVVGSVIGFFIGSTTIPRIIYSAFYQFILPELEVKMNYIHLLLIAGTAILLMTCVTVFFCYMELRQSPSALMRPKPPKKGQTIFLENIEIIWKRLSFTWKVTIRNIFRYKQRVLMTIVGVAGCVALLLTGFGIKDSINGVALEQYGEIFRYDLMLILSEERTELSNELSEILNRGNVVNPLLLNQSTVEVMQRQKIVEAFMVVPENEGDFEQYFHLTDRKGEETLMLEDDGVIITEKLAQVFRKEKGDTITIMGEDNLSYSLTILGVAQNYIKNYIYMSKSYYQQLFPEHLKYNMIVCDTNDTELVMAEELLEDGEIIQVALTKDIIRTAEEGNSSLNSVVVMIVFIALLLVIIVLYNLTSINISERKREIATLKVLGFTDLESNQYIYREAVILTLMSSLVGLFLGVFLHGFILGIIEGDMNVYYKEIKVPSYIYTVLIVIGVNLMMQIVTNLKTKKIDMIESLKSVE